MEYIIHLSEALQQTVTCINGLDLNQAPNREGDISSAQTVDQDVPVQTG